MGFINYFRNNTETPKSCIYIVAPKEFGPFLHLLAELSFKQNSLSVISVYFYSFYLIGYLWSLMFCFFVLFCFLLKKKRTLCNFFSLKGKMLIWNIYTDFFFLPREHVVFCTHYLSISLVLTLKKKHWETEDKRIKLTSELTETK